MPKYSNFKKKPVEGNIFQSIGQNFKDLFEQIMTGKNNLVGNWFKSKTGSGITDKAKEEMDYSTELERNKWDTMYSLSARIQDGQQAGVNPFVVATGASNAGASSGPQSSSAGNFSPLDLIGMLMNFALTKKDQELTADRNDIEDRRVSVLEGQSPSVINRNNANADYFGAQTDRINQLIPLEKENFKARTDEFLQNINESKSREALNQAGIEVAEAEAELKLQQAAIAEIDAKHKDEYWENNARLQIAQEALTKAETERNYVEANRARQEIQNLKTQNDNLLKEGVGILLENGKLAHEFNMLGVESDNQGFKIKHENRALVIDNICTCITTGVNVLSSASSFWRASSYSNDTNSRWAYKAALAAIKAGK